MVLEVGRVFDGLRFRTQDEITTDLGYAAVGKDCFGGIRDDWRHVIYYRGIATPPLPPPVIDV